VAVICFHFTRQRTNRSHTRGQGRNGAEGKGAGRECRRGAWQKRFWFMFWRDPRSDLATVRAAARRRTPKRSRVEKRCAATSTLSVFELKKNVVLPRMPMQSSRETAVVRRPGI